MVMGLNHNTASVEVRERLNIKKESYAKCIQSLRGTRGIQECVILSTCNRTEIYAVVDNLHTGKLIMTGFFLESLGLNKLECINFFYTKENDDTIKHLFRVVCGLDSLVIGETQILGQVKESFIISQTQKATSTVFNMLFKKAITFAKRVHSNTDLGKNAVSVSYAAIELGKKIFGHFHYKTVVILGAGEMGELTAKHLHTNGAGTIIVVNRTYERAMNLANKFSGEAKTMDQIQNVLSQADIVISSIDVKGPIITKQDMETINLKRKHRPLYMIDIAVPRSIDPEINNFDHVFLYNIDDLEDIVAANLNKRAEESKKINSMIENELLAFKSWINTLDAVPLMAALQEKSLFIHEEAMRHIENKLPNLTQKELKVIRKYSKSIVNQMLHDPLMGIKEINSHTNKEEVLELFIQLFALEGILDEQNQIGESELQHWPTPYLSQSKIPVHS
ncbi:glutamyl-tRNA reductase [Fictibacillus sp. WQ 8-8]|uniref:glutamyl-tRNA reductase n=1 Tax=Fictibacillus sp. WQ 8-8 TaxID=2938788 RepID=UPI00210B5724|nr:glutamyl-tRNA reductase [Fictibacillus sp. WQ 8-8]MCQ6267793.1 glutamyl-tRNA reductase [Fictibacillus sp. WQ 8-8]